MGCAARLGEAGVSWNAGSEGAAGGSSGLAALAGASKSGFVGFFGIGTSGRCVGVTCIGECIELDDALKEEGRK